MRRTAGTAAGALVLAVSLTAAPLAGCTASGSSSSAGSGSDAGAPAGSSGGAAAVGKAGGAAAPPTAAPAAATQRQVVTTASARLSVQDPARAADRVAALVERIGGRTQERSEDDPGGGARSTARLVVRVPAATLTTTLDDLRDVGTVTRVSVHSDDVTATAVDLDARISALRTSTARLQGLLDRAATTADLVAAESALSDRQAQLESLQSQRALLAGQVDLATLTLSIVPRGAVAAGGPAGFGGGLASGWHALARSGSVLLVVLGALLPWALVLGLLAAGAAAAVRGVRAARRRGRVAG